MEQYGDLRRFEAVWQRVLPAMEPYPHTAEAVQKAEPEHPSVLPAIEKPVVRQAAKRCPYVSCPAARGRSFVLTAAAALLIAARCMKQL